jgi:hypothetical protein
MARVARLEAAKKAKDFSALLELLGPVRECPIYGGLLSWDPPFSDPFKSAVLAELFAGANTETIIEAGARCQTVELEKHLKPGLFIRENAEKQKTVSGALFPRQMVSSHS